MAACKRLGKNWRKFSKQLRIAEDRLQVPIPNFIGLAIVAHLKKVKVSTVGDIAEKIDLSFKATSKHLSVLYAADIVEREQVSLTMNYTLTEPLHKLVQTALNLL